MASIGTSPAIGIHLGTTSSCMGVYKHGEVEIVPDNQGNTRMLSCVAFTDTKILVGNEAKIQAVSNPENTIFDIKRLIGRKISEEKLQHERELWPFEIVNEDGRMKVKVKYKGKDRTFAPEELCSMILTRLKQTAEAFLGQEVANAVISVPAHFNDSQRQATIDAGSIAGFKVISLINASSAVALSYWLYDQEEVEDDEEVQEEECEKNVLIFYLGGGVLDISIVEVHMESILEMKSTAGDTHFGGEDFDARLVAYLAYEIKKKHNKDVYQNASFLARLKNACEEAKKTLSTSCEEYHISIESLIDDISINTTITRSQFEELCKDLFLLSLESVKKALTDTNLDVSLIHNVILAGSSTEIPLLQKFLSDFFRKKELWTFIKSDEAMVIGATVHAAILTGIANETTKDALLLEVTPLTLVIEGTGGVKTTLIPQGTTIPANTSLMLTTDTDKQSEIHIRVFEEEQSTTKQKYELGTFTLTDIPPFPRGVPDIKVTFEVDANGILRVSALDKRMGNIKPITIKTDKGRLSQNEIQKMISKAKKYSKDYSSSPELNESN